MAGTKGPGVKGAGTDARRERDLLDEIAWLHAELHGAELEAERLRKKPSTPPPTMPEQPPYDLLIDLLREDWGIEACWDGLRKFWYIGLTEREVQVREQLEAENDALRELVGDLAEEYRLAAESEGVFALKAGLFERMRELGVVE